MNHYIYVVYYVGHFYLLYILSILIFYIMCPGDITSICNLLSLYILSGIN